MECPQCKTPLTRGGRYCSGCGGDFGEALYERLTLYFGLKEELVALHAASKSLTAGMERIQAQLGRYEKELGRELQVLPTEPLAATVKPVEQVVPAAPVFEARGEGAPAYGKQIEAPTEKPREPRAIHDADFEANLGQKWLLIIGIITMVFGVGYFLKYSFEQGWVGPAGRVAMTFVWGALFLVAGERFRKRDYEVFGLYLAGGGIATFYFAAFAGFQIYHLFSQPVSFLLMVLITALACTLAVIYDTKWLAVLGLVGGFLTPLLLSTGQDNYLFLFSYMAILNGGLLAIALSRKWDLLNVLGFICTWLLYGAWYLEHYQMEKFWPALLFLIVFYLIYSIIPFAAEFVRPGGLAKRGIALLTPNSFIAFGFSYAMIRERFAPEWASIVTVCFAGMFLAMASYLYRRDEKGGEGFVALLANGLLFLVLTIPILFSRHWITIFWGIQALTLLWAGLRLERKSLMFGAYALLAVTVIKFLGYDYPVIFNLEVNDLEFRPDYTFMLAERLITTLLVLGAVNRFAMMARRGSLRLLSQSEEWSDAGAFFAVGGISLFIVLNVETSAFFLDYLPMARFAAISVLWALFSVGLVLLGFRNKSALLRKLALGLFLVTLIKVFLFDMANISTPYRIVSFIILGLFMVGTSYLYHRFKERIGAVIGGEEER